MELFRIAIGDNKYCFQLDLTDFYDEDYDLDTDDENQDSGDSDYANGDDSGNGET